MVAPAEIRARLREFLGEEKYPTFVMHVPSHAEGTRLKFWMERAWERFEAAHPDCKLTFAQIVDVFSSCPEHGAQIRRTRYLQLIGTWLTAQVDVTKLESENQFQDDRHGDRPVAFGFQSDQWQQLKSQFQDGDQWYNFRSPPETWANLAGRAGVALVRDGEVIDMLVTSLN